MTPREKKSLEICLKKKHRITIDDFDSIYIGVQTRKNLIKKFIKLGYIMPTDIAGYFHMPATAVNLAITELNG